MNKTAKKMRKLYRELLKASAAEERASEADYNDAMDHEFNCRRKFENAFEEVNGFKVDDVWKVL